MPVKGGPHPSVSLDSGEKSLPKAGKPYMVNVRVNDVVNGRVNLR